MAGKFCQMGGGGHIYFGHIFFVTVSFEPESKTLFKVLFSSLCLQIFFYFGIYRIFYIFSAARETYIKTKRCLHPRGLEKPEIDSTDQSTPWFARASGYIWPSIHVARACE